MKSTVLITGASSGLGKQFARIFAHEQYNCVLVARNTEKLNVLKKQIEEKYHIQAHVISCDLSRPEACQIIMDDLQKHQYSIDILINNAGFGDFGDFAHADLTRMQEMIDVNIRSLVSLTHQLLPSMIERKSGKILNIASLAAFQSGPLMAVYYASKAFVLSFSEALHEELKKSGITVCALCPGPTRTEFFKNAQLEPSGLFYNLQVADPKKIAIAGYRQLMHQKAVHVPGMQNQLAVFAQRFTPRALNRKIVMMIQKEKTGFHR